MANEITIERALFQRYRATHSMKTELDEDCFMIFEGTPKALHGYSSIVFNDFYWKFIKTLSVTNIDTTLDKE